MTTRQPTDCAALQLEWIVTEQSFLRGVVAQYKFIGTKANSRLARWQWPIIFASMTAIFVWVVTTTDSGPGTQNARLCLTLIASACGFAAALSTIRLAKRTFVTEATIKKLIAKGVIEQPLGRQRVTIGLSTYEAEWIDGGHFLRLPAAAFTDIVKVDEHVLLCSTNVVRSVIPVTAIPGPDPLQSVRSALAGPAPSAPPIHRTTLPTFTSPPSDAPPSD